MLVQDGNIRNYYRRDGGADWAVFVRMGLLGLLAAVGLAFLLSLAYRIGFYVLLIVPLAGAGVLSMVLHQTVKKSHCRNYPVALALGLLLGIIYYAGHFYFNMLFAAGMDQWRRVDSLPRYVAFEITYSETVRIGEGMSSKVATSGESEAVSEELPPAEIPQIIVNVLIAVGEIFLVLLFCYAGVIESTVPYDTGTRRRFRTLNRFFKPGIAGLFTQGFTIDALQQLLKHPRTGSKGPSASVSLYYLPAKADEIAANPQQYPLYLEISDGRRTVCKMIELLPEEITVLQPMFEQQLTPYCEALGQVEAHS